jgi:hypothetical protein
MSEQDNIVLACNIGAINPAERDQHILTTRELFGAVLDVQESADGYAFRLPTDPSMLRGAAEFIARESQCCPFFNFTLKRLTGDGGLWLSLTGNADIKAFIQVEFGSILNPDLSARLAAS